MTLYCTTSISPSPVCDHSASLMSPLISTSYLYLSSPSPPSSSHFPPFSFPSFSSLSLFSPSLSPVLFIFPLPSSVERKAQTETLSSCAHSLAYVPNWTPERNQHCSSMSGCAMLSTFRCPNRYVRMRVSVHRKRAASSVPSSQRLNSFSCVPISYTILIPLHYSHSAFLPPPDLPPETPTPRDQLFARSSPYSHSVLTPYPAHSHPAMRSLKGK